MFSKSLEILYTVVSTADQDKVGLSLKRMLANLSLLATHGNRALPGGHNYGHQEPHCPPLCQCLPPGHALLCSPNREIISLVARVVPIYAVSHLFEGLAVSTVRYLFSRLYDPRVSADDGRF